MPSQNALVIGSFFGDYTQDIVRLDVEKISKRFKDDGYSVHALITNDRNQARIAIWAVLSLGGSPRIGFTGNGSPHSQFSVHKHGNDIQFHKLSENDIWVFQYNNYHNEQPFISSELVSINDTTISWHELHTWYSNPDIRIGISQYHQAAHWTPIPTSDNDRISSLSIYSNCYFSHSWFKFISFDIPFSLHTTTNATIESSFYDSHGSRNIQNWKFFTSKD